jgi:phage shock protein B
MDDNAFYAILLAATLITALCVIGVCVPCVVWLTRNREARLAKADAVMVEQAMQAAGRMEARIAMLEQILDAEAPSWRRRLAEAGEP